MGNNVPNKNLLPVQFGTLPEGMATLHKLWEALPLNFIDARIWRGVPTSNQTRTQPGVFDTVDQSTVIEVYRAWLTNGYSNFGFTSPFSYQFILMVTCTIFKGWHDYPLYGRLYCYDNVWADTLMQGGRVKGGAWGYYDPFTWEGYGMMWFARIMWTNLRTMIKNTIYATLFIVWYLANDDMVWCFPGETMPIFSFFNGCNFFGIVY